MVIRTPVNRRDTFIVKSPSVVIVILYISIHEMPLPNQTTWSELTFV